MIFCKRFQFRYSGYPSRDIFECPEVFKIQVDEDPNITKWILMLSIGDRNRLDFIRNFDGKVFTLDETLEPYDTIKWIDYGSDFYAAVTWDGIPNEDARKFWVGWMNNWRYASTLSSEE
ncbi:hypothetical protein [Paenibacillus sp. 203]|uniref:hypothetical protein n=1 Tax=Paenibacillus sp. 203 TaxID=3096765 RepID=UPI002285B7F9